MKQQLFYNAYIYLTKITGKGYVLWKSSIEAFGPAQKSGYEASPFSANGGGYLVNVSYFANMTLLQCLGSIFQTSANPFLSVKAADPL